MLACRIQPGEMELGLGIHGEPGASKGPLKPVDQIVAQVSRTYATYSLTSLSRKAPDDPHVSQEGVHGKPLARQLPLSIPAAACVLGQQACLGKQAASRTPLGPYLLNERSVEVDLARDLKTRGGAADAAENHVA